MIWVLHGKLFVFLYNSSKKQSYSVSIQRIFFFFLTNQSFDYCADANVLYPLTDCTHMLSISFITLCSHDVLYFGSWGLPQFIMKKLLSFGLGLGLSCNLECPAAVHRKFTMFFCEKVMVQSGKPTVTTSFFLLLSSSSISPSLVNGRLTSLK